MPLPLAGLTVVSLEQAVAAPMCTCRLADAGARVIKIERPEGDFRALAIPTTGCERGDAMHEDGRDALVSVKTGVNALMVVPARAPISSGSTAASNRWCSISRSADDKALLAAMLAKADVFVQNLKPGAIAKLGFALDELRRAHPRLVICSISGYGEDGPYAARKAYDMLIQAESGLASVTGGPEAPARVGVSVCDIAAGMNAYEAILEALIARERPATAPPSPSPCSTPWPTGWRCRSSNTRAASRPGAWGSRTPRSRPTACSRPGTAPTF